MGFFTFTTTTAGLRPEYAWIPTLLVAIYGYYVARYPQIRHEDYTWDKKEKKRVVQLTDLHIGDIWSERDLQDSLEKAEHLDPDIIAITGDLVDGMHHIPESVYSSLKNVDIPILFVTGNHDGYHDRQTVIDSLEKNGVVVLEDETKIINGICVHGVAYKTPWQQTKEQIEKENVDVLLKHEPSVTLSDTAVAILSGHIHAGQVWPLHLIALLDFSYVKGTYTNGQGLLHVSTGTRLWGPPLRIGTRSEIFVLDLVPR